jgi:hypothetical protein
VVNTRRLLGSDKTCGQALGSAWIKLAGMNCRRAVVDSPLSWITSRGLDSCTSLRVWQGCFCLLEYFSKKTLISIVGQTVVQSPLGRDNVRSLLTVRVGVNQEPTVAFTFLSSLVGFGGLKPIVHLLFRTSAMQMYSSPCVSDRTPNPSCCTYSRARSLGKPKSKGSPHRAYT